MLNTLNQGDIITERQMGWETTVPQAITNTEAMTITIIKAHLDCLPQ